MASCYKLHVETKGHVKAGIFSNSITALSFFEELWPASIDSS